MSAGDEVAARARACVGVRFRPQGRSAESGLDCIGLVAVAAGVPMEDVPGDYHLRADDAERLHAGLRAAGFVEIDGATKAGDVLVARAGFSQAHLAVLTRDGFVHADAGSRRVAEVPGAVPWVVLSGWRLAVETGG